jgi:hypothetical protein
MAEELAQLRAETVEAERPGGAVMVLPGIETAKAKAVEVKVGAETPVAPELAAAVDSIMKNPVKMADGSKPLPERGSGKAVVATADVAVATEAVAAKDAVVVEEAHPLKTMIESLPDTRVEVVERRPNILARMWGLVTDVLVMILQIIDMPFGWVKEPEKNVIGIWAFCLLVGGAILFGWAKWMQGQLGG